MPIDMSRMLSVARSQRGYRERGNNNQKYSPAVPGLEWSQNQPWCATFTCWVFLQAGGTPGTDFPLTASCLQQVAWGRSHGRFHATPRVGDLMMIGPGGGTHVEIVVAVSGGTVTTIGGNTSGSWNGNYANGDGVYQKTRSAASAYGYVRPYYGTQTTDSPREDDMPDFNWYSSSGGQTLKPGEWTTIEFDAKKGGKTGSYWSVVTGPVRYILKASLTLDGADLPKGTEVQLRASHYKQQGGITLPSGVYKRGASGAAVKQIQAGLIKLGYKLPRFGADGDYGTETVEAVKRLQRDAGITADGEYGPNTKKAMATKAGPAKWVKTMDHPLDGTVHGGGDCHVAYVLPEDCPKGYRVRIRAVQHGPRAVRVKAGKAVIHEWPI